MKIDFFEVPEEGLSLDLVDAQWCPADILKKGHAVASLFLKRIGPRVIAGGTLSATVVLDCDRCLAPFDLPLQAHFKIDIELPDGQADVWEHGDHQCHDEEMDVHVLENTKIDVSDILLQQLYLALPMKALCNDECRGICESCGINRNKLECECKQETVSPFAVLAKLKT